MKTKELVNPYHSLYLVKPYYAKFMFAIVNAGIVTTLLGLLLPPLFLFGVLLMYTPNITWYLQSKY